MNLRDQFTASAGRLSRRNFLGKVGLGAAGTATALRIDLLLGAPAAEAAPFDSGLPDFPGAFGRLFPKLPPFAPSTDAVRAALTDTGTHFMGQFMDHDMTFDATSPLGQPTDPTNTRNFRTARFDLDSVSGLGPIGSPHLYDPKDPVKFRIGSGGIFEDLPRQMDLDGSSNAIALVGDPRNDENMIISGLTAAFLLFHNHAVDYVRGHEHDDPLEVFLQARLLTTWHYQWMIVHEFLPLFIGQDMVNTILREAIRAFSRPVMAVGSFRSNSRQDPIGLDIVWSGHRTAPTSKATMEVPSSASSSTRRRIQRMSQCRLSPILMIYPAELDRRGVSLVGRHSSISVTVR